MVWLVFYLVTKFTMREYLMVDSIWYIYALMVSETASKTTPTMKAMMT